jgi:hypothetical protein
MVKKEDLGWLAGIIDGEGTTTIRMKIRKTKNYGLRPRFWTEVSIVNTDLMIINNCRRILDDIQANYRVNGRDRKKYNCKYQYVVTLNGNGIKKIIPLIKHLCMKRPELEILEQALELGNKNQIRTGNKDGFKGKSPMSDDVLKKFDDLRTSLFHMHGRQAANFIKLRAQDYNQYK